MDVLGSQASSKCSSARTRWYIVILATHSILERRNSIDSYRDSVQQSMKEEVLTEG
jgi:hypothetical protein